MWVFYSNIVNPKEMDFDEPETNARFISKSLPKLKKAIIKHYNTAFPVWQKTSDEKPDELNFNKDKWGSVTEKYCLNVVGWIRKIKEV